MPKSMNGTIFVYDYSGHRVKKNSTVYIGKLYECTSGTCIKYIFAGSNRVAMKTGSSVYYYHTDHLGSSSVITDSSGIMKEEIYYYPFGKTRSNTGTLNVKHKFTGQELDDETGLYNYGARYYDPALGRFTSPDSIVQDYTDPQTLNRYSYCGNNPIILTDPSGNDFGLSAIIIGAIIGALSSGAQSDWNVGAMITGAVIGGVSGGVFSGVEGAVAGAINITNSTIAGAISGAAGGAAAGATAGGLNAAIYDGNIGQAMLRGGLIGGAVGGVMGAITGSSNSAQYRGQAIEDDPLYFNGKELIASDLQGNVIDTWQATSGKSGSTTSLADQSKIGYGPIPEGNYSVNPNNIQRWSDLPWYQKAAACFNRGEWPGGVPAWGHFRVQIDIPGGSILGRGGFFIHGGWFEGSAGCIDLGANATSFFRYFSEQQNPIPLTVKY